MTRPKTLFHTRLVALIGSLITDQILKKSFEYFIPSTKSGKQAARPGSSLHLILVMILI